MALGENVARFRRKKGLTQEALGALVGVSMQAVSKWENGGLPDATLIPAIAGALSVSTDALFGLTAAPADVEAAIARDIADTPREERIRRAFELCWALERALFGARELEPADHIGRYIGKENDTYSQYHANNGITLMKVDKLNHYFLLSPEPEGGRAARLVNPDAHVKLFALLGQRDVYDVLIFLHKRDKNPFTARLLENQLSIPEARGREILKTLAEYALVTISSLDLDDESIEVYTAHPNPSLIGFLTFANEVCAPPVNFSWYTGIHERPYLGGGA